MEMMYAKYTMCLIDAIAEKPDLMDGISLSTTTRTNALKNMIMAMFWNYEISGETLQEEASYLKYTCDEWKHYYEELLDAYERGFDWAVGEVTYSAVSGTDTKEDVFTPRAQYSSTTEGERADHTELYDLPRSSPTIDRPTRKDDGSVTNTSTTTNGGVDGSDTRSVEGSMSSTARVTKGDMIELRKRYIETIRDVTKEFAGKFKKCFLMLFD